MSLSLVQENPLVYMREDGTVSVVLSFACFAHEGQHIVKYLTDNEGIKVPLQFHSSCTECEDCQAEFGNQFNELI